MKISGTTIKVALTQVRVTVVVKNITPATAEFSINGELFSLEKDEVMQMLTGASTKLWVEDIYQKGDFWVAKTKLFTDYGEAGGPYELTVGNTVTIDIKLSEGIPD